MTLVADPQLTGQVLLTHIEQFLQTQKTPLGDRDMVRLFTAVKTHLGENPELLTQMLLSRENKTKISRVSSKTSADEGGETAKVVARDVSQNDPAANHDWASSRHSPNGQLAHVPVVCQTPAELINHPPNSKTAHKKSPRRLSADPFGLLLCEKIYPPFLIKIKKLLARASEQNVTVRVLDAYRDDPKGGSFHNYGLAVDIDFAVTADTNKTLLVLNKIILMNLAEAQGLFVRSSLNPTATHLHFEYPHAVTISECQQAWDQCELEAVWALLSKKKL